MQLLYFEDQNIKLASSTSSFRYHTSTRRADGTLLQDAVTIFFFSFVSVVL